MPLKVNYANARQIEIHIRMQFDTPENSAALKQILSSVEGGTPTTLLLHKSKKRINLPPSLCFTPTADIISRIEAILGDGSVEIR